MISQGVIYRITQLSNLSNGDSERPICAVKGNYAQIPSRSSFRRSCQTRLEAESSRPFHELEQFPLERHQHNNHADLNRKDQHIAILMLEKGEISQENQVKSHHQKNGLPQVNEPIGKKIFAESRNKPAATPPIMVVPERTNLQTKCWRHWAGCLCSQEFLSPFYAFALGQIIVILELVRKKRFFRKA
ncbi:MAG: hypothetical protein PHV34_07645 [Verrucomicrobiae bacterium]|nr:hypothetical protein [Verrucomicrobiae bacterium]